jgi:hypothetical protein
MVVRRVVVDEQDLVSGSDITSASALKLIAARLWRL